MNIFCKENFEFYIILLITTAFSCLLNWLLLKYGKPQIYNKILFFLCSYIAVFLLLVELGNILYNFNINSSLHFWLCISSIALVVLSTKIKDDKNYKAILMLSISCILFSNYQLNFKDTLELFETSNLVLPIQQYFEFGQLPLLATFNGHLLSDTWYGFIHSFIYGYDGSSKFINYAWLNYLLAMIVIYYFFKSIIKNAWHLFIILLLSPIIISTIPNVAFLALVSPLILNSIILSNNYNYLKFKSLCIGLITILLCCYRTEVGIANFIACIVLLTIVVIQQSNKYATQIIQYYILGILIAMLPFTIYYLQHSTICNYNIKMIWGYLKGAQRSSGLPLWDVKHPNQILAYTALPLIIIGICLHSFIIYLSRPNIKIQQYILTIIYCCIYTIYNFRRGFRGHTVLEGDDQLLSFSYLIIFIYCIWQISYLKNYVTKIIVSLLLFALLISTKNNWNLDGALPMYKIIENPTALKEQLSYFKQSPITTDSVQYSSTIAPLKHYFDQHLSKKETFMDFSNSPMLYHYLKRPLPDYFCLLPLMLQHSSQEKLFVKNISSKKLKYCVFQNAPTTFWDNVFGISNTIRHPYLRDYIYENYAPDTIIANHWIWKLKTIKNNNTHNIRANETQHLQWLPNILANKSSFIKEKDSLQITFKNTNKISLPKWSNNTMLKLKINNSSLQNQNCTATILFDSLSSCEISFTTMGETTTDYLLPFNVNYNWYLAGKYDLYNTINLKMALPYCELQQITLVNILDY
jgi:hypothetical protein